MNDLSAVPDEKEEEWLAIESTTPGESDVLEGGKGGYSVIGTGFITAEVAKEIASRHNASIQRVLEKASTLSDNVKAQPDQRKVGQDELLGVVKAAYLKHHCGLDNVGWDALGDMMQNALCNVMGDVEFQRWLAEDHNVD